MGKRKTKAEQAADLHYAQTRAFISLLLSSKELKLHWEARFGEGSWPGKKAFDAVDLRMCKRNVQFLDEIMDGFQLVQDRINAMPKQGDMVDNMEEKEAQLKEELLGGGEEDEDPELGPRPPEAAMA